MMESEVNEPKESRIVYRSKKGDTKNLHMAPPGEKTAGPLEKVGDKKDCRGEVAKQTRYKKRSSGNHRNSRRRKPQVYREYSGNKKNHHNNGGLEKKKEMSNRGANGVLPRQPRTKEFEGVG